MRRSFHIFIALCVLGFTAAAPAFARSHPTPTPAPTPTPVEDPAVTKFARQQFVAWQAGNVNKSLYVPQIQAKLTDEHITDISRELGALGPLTGTVYIGPMLVPDAPDGSKGYIYQMLCAEHNVYLFMIISPDGKIGSFLFKDRLDAETVKVQPTPSPSASPG
jgi:hypothetical protein